MEKQLDRMTKAMGRRLDILVHEGKKCLMKLFKLPSWLQRLASSFGKAFLSFHIGKITKKTTYTTKPLRDS
jgi:hypothetical protein